MVYAGGEFTTIGGQSRHFIAAIDISTGDATSWNPNASKSVRTIALGNEPNTIYAGGVFSTIGGKTRIKLASINLGTGLTR